MELKASIQKATSFGFLVAACGAISKDSSGLTSTTLSAAIARPFISAGFDAFDIIEPNRRRACVEELERIHGKVDDMVRRHLPANGEQRSLVSAALADFDANLPSSLPSNRVVVEHEFDAQRITEIVLQRISEKCRTIVPVARTGGVWQRARDPANHIVRMLLHETLILVLKSTTVNETLSTNLSSDSLENLESLLLGPIAEGRRNRKTAMLLKEGVPDNMFSQRIFYLQRLADEASLAVRSSDRAIGGIQEAVEVLKQNV